MPTKDPKRVREFEEGLSVLQGGVNKINWILEGIETHPFTSEDYIRYYTIIYNLSDPNPRRDFSLELYDKYKEILEEHVTSKVLPCLRGKKDQDLLQVFVKKWSDYKIMAGWLSRFFNYLDRYFIPRKRLTSLREISFMTFHNLVYGEIKCQERSVVLSMINQERDGEQIDQALVNSTMAIYVEMGIDSLKYYDRYFEEAMLKDSAAFYSQKASNWIQNKSYKDYKLMVAECLKHEKEVVSCYLQAKTQKKLLEVIEHELLDVHANELEEKKAAL